ncbi:MAG: hypothetical protein M1490_01500 [Candidatus Bathyarchaeota archaeon]|nr:hypothetical protein [Candidatus Bathyarchaeota archaeon]
MNWKNVLFLLRVERKSGRLIRGVKTTRYRENAFLAYWPYWVSLIIGVLAGFIANFAVASIYSSSAIPNLPSLKSGSLSVFVTLPTIVLVFSFVFTLLQQIQVAGIKAAGQVMYWLPITWQEQTMASILSNLLGLPIALVLGIGAGIIVFGAFTGLILQAILTSLALLATAFMASTSTEILRLLQMRFIGAVYKSSGRAAIWVRLIGTLFIFVVFYTIYSYVLYGTGALTFFTTLQQVQSVAWFVPFIWLALTIGNIFGGLYLQGLLFTASSALFIAALYYLAVVLNQRFGLYEPPAITLQKSGVYAPKTGLLGKLGFSTAEAAVIRKDLRAFTRRREMVSVFIAPIILIILPLTQSLGISGSAASSQGSFIFSGIIFLLPATFMAILLGEVLIGEEGQSVWRIYASPISPKNLVKSKTFFLMLFSTITLLISGSVGVVFYHPTLQEAIAAFLEGFFVLLAVGMVALTVGFKGPDFSQSRRARMVRQEWSLIGLAVCAVAGAAVLAPLIFSVGLSLFTGGVISTSSLAIAVAISGAISLGLSIVFYRINLGIAADFLRKAQI